jgi:hypothetical protein
VTVWAFQSMTEAGPSDPGPEVCWNTLPESGKGETPVLQIGFCKVISISSNPTKPN